MSKKVWPAPADVKKASKEGIAVFREFREFAVRGNVVDMAVGIIVGAAFGTVVKSLVSDIILPPFALVVKKDAFSSLVIHLGRSAKAPTIHFGAFLDNVISFLIVSFAIFLVVRQMNRLKRQQEQAPKTKECPYCLSSIPIKATRCAHCTADLPADAKVAS